MFGTKLSSIIKKIIEKKIKNKNMKINLATVIVGNKKESLRYVKNKVKACKEVGIFTHNYNLCKNISQQKLNKKLTKLNNNKNIHGILLQLPLPKHLCERDAISNISPSKDVDCQTEQNLGKILSTPNKPILKPCTPYGIMQLLYYYNIDLIGKHVVIVGNSLLVGRPLSVLLSNMGASVTICHDKTANLDEKIKLGDIVVVAIGVPQFVRSSWIKKNAIVIDVGFNVLNDGKIVGDVDERIKEITSYYTPVPGGVGPMTVSSLLLNALTTYELQND